MRIIAGEFRRRILKTPRDADVTRPYPDRVKESLFSLLRGQFEGAEVFDAFAGVGTIGLEAISRGAKRCVFIERDRDVASILRENIEALGVADRCEVVVGDALGVGALARCPSNANLVFMDPPYPLMRDEVGFRRVMAQLEHLIGRLAPGGFAILRTPWPMEIELPIPGSSLEAPVPVKRKRKKEHWRWEQSERARDRSPARDPEAEEEVEADPEAEPSPRPKVERRAMDLHLPNALGPETHAYHSMAVHLYTRRG